MTYIKDSIYNTSLPILIMDREKQYLKYPEIGSGEEGVVLKFDDKKAIKVFDAFINKEKLVQKFAKIEELGKIKDKSFCFPQGLVGYLDLKKEGYYMDLVTPMEKCPNFSELRRLKDDAKMFEYVLMADKAMERIHKKGIVLGDISDDHILINKCGEVKFIDTDNYRFSDYGYDLVPCRSRWFKNIYHKNVSGKDSDIFIFTMMVLQYFIDGSTIKLHRSDEYFKKLIEYLEVSPEVKDGLRLILSDAENKPYVGKVLKKVKFDHRLLTMEKADELNDV